MQGGKGLIKFWFLVVPVALLFYVGLWLTIVFRYQDTLGHATASQLLRTFSFIFLLWLVVFFIHGLFETEVFRRYTSLVFSLVSATIVNVLIAVIYFYFQPNLVLTPRRFLLIDVTVTFVLLLGWYLLMKYFLQNKLVEGVYIFSFDGGLRHLEGEITSHSYLGYKVLGRLAGGSLGESKVEKNSIIILPDNLHSTPQVSEQLYRLRTSGVIFYNHKDFYELLLRRIYLSDLNELWFLENIDYQEKRFYNFGKRIVDLILGFIGIFFFVVSYPFCALAIKLTSPGPVLFVQERAGKQGKLFKVYKYRSMSGGPSNTWTSVNDPRITKVGKFLRKSRIDEWPQFINLLLGHISLVGPRPEQPHIVEELKKQIPFYDERHLVKPGITGWAQLNIYAGSLEESKLKLQYDLYYIKHRSFLFDLEIILKTIYYIFTWQGR
jgi:exopolysaccharide biosynthesis polyprenyl glycosylphosphotransferase